MQLCLSRGWEVGCGGVCVCVCVRAAGWLGGELPSPARDCFGVLIQIGAEVLRASPVPNL